MKTTRRELIAVVAGAATSLAQTQPANDAPDWLKLRRDTNRASADALDKPVVPMSVEPAFQFKA